MAFYDDPEVHELPGLIPEACKIIVYDKGPSSCTSPHIPNASECIVLPNTGLEQHTFLNYALTRSTLPDYVVFTPGSLRKHDRWDKLSDEMVKSGYGQGGPSDFVCIRGGVDPGIATPGSLYDGRGGLAVLNRGQLYEYNNHMVEYDDATTPVGTTHGEFLAYWGFMIPEAGIVPGSGQLKPGCAELCGFGSLATTRANLLVYPTMTLRGLTEHVAKYRNPADIFYMEFTEEVIFGAKSPCGEKSDTNSSWAPRLPPFSPPLSPPPSPPPPSSPSPLPPLPNSKHKNERLRSSDGAPLRRHVGRVSV